ncbi:hypothetical protein [Paraburkholderia flagellata]|uniref:hypothetical protein n=1 Tax=Paraburkholderia flagellata TaxID=2883241 RepID=UPI001F31D6C4|nr:hypothetical protein [Paraburkholderia flagellata]
MTQDLATARLSIDSQIVNSLASNYRLTSWPPKDDFPIVIDRKGNVISRFGDPYWDLTVWNDGVSLRLYFGAHLNKANKNYISPENARLLKLISVWILYFDREFRKAVTLYSFMKRLKPIFVICTKNNVLASDLTRFPALLETALEKINGTFASTALCVFHQLFEHRNEIGFIIFDRCALKTISDSANFGEKFGQTAYIPPRIWTYQLNRLRECLDDFIRHADDVSKCFNYCLDAYVRSYGSLKNATASGRDLDLAPFNVNCPEHLGGYRGPFRDVAKKFGIAELLERWTLRGSGEAGQLPVSTLTSYFQTIMYVSLIYILNFSLMRVSEATRLRSNCLEIDDDPTFGPIYLLHGVTTKSYDDDDARWVVSVSARVAVEAATIIARLRAKSANLKLPHGRTTKKDSSVLLFTPACEPWAQGAPMAETAFRWSPKSYGEMITLTLANVFDPCELRVTKEDLEIARLVTPSLDAEKFKIGAIWPLAYHQLRRTGMVNMQASGIVSESSMQYQAKHARRAMSLYYGQGYSQVAVNRSARREYIRTMYEMLGKEIERLFQSRFVSPYGRQRKSEILHLVSDRDSKKILAAGKAGKVTCRQTLLGMCARRDVCKFGGIDNIVHCAGDDKHQPCYDALFDRAKEAEIFELRDVLDEQLLKAAIGSPLYDSLLAQRCAAEKVLGYFAKRK